MGVPKFFRWMSERYPLCSELIGRGRIPEYDNLYLDMNGIIHNCSHPNDDDPMFRITETQIFLSIFSYIDYVFSTIKPKKVFMMAVDGVAPRAKMNQQRARRFRSANDAKLNAEKAERSGNVLPTEDAFDSNCITPGTPFMDRLQSQLKYYVNKKISEDSDWKHVQVILSGHDVPGEGEHKIMEYIRNTKAAPNYDPNIRHCLYGLDADLVMLGLLSHEPHFSLLREEVTFGRKTRSSSPKAAHEQNFYLLHLSLLREYLSFEFSILKESLSFEYDFERVLDDFVLLCFFVGNDFLPHLPGLHINEGGLATLFEIYKTILPMCGGYLNNNGYLNLEYCQIFFSHLEELEKEEFKNFQGDSKWMEGKKSNNRGPKRKQALILTEHQVFLLQQVKGFLSQSREQDSLLQLNWSKMPAGDRHFMLQLISDLGLAHSIEVHEVETVLEITWSSEDEESDQESFEARERVLKKYDSADRRIAETQKDKEVAFEEAWTTWKQTYYAEKLEFGLEQKEKLSSLVYSYVEGLQWVLLYYYHGVASWEWFFPYYYAPKISDLKEISALKFDFDIGAPFFPFEQLMAVLPPYSRQHVPPCLQDLMTDAHSPIIDFYPTSFELDMNGKKGDWEAIVKIPFIDEKRLLKFVRGRENRLNADEKRRNARGATWEFRLMENPISFVYPSISTAFPALGSCICEMKFFSLVPKPKEKAINHLNAGALIESKMRPGFPSVYTLPFTSTLGFHGVNVFNADSKNPSHVITILDQFNDTPEESAMRLIGRTVFTDWPFLVESHVLSLSDEYFVYQKKRSKRGDTIVKTPHTDESFSEFTVSCERSEKHYSKRFGVLFGAIEMVAKLETLVGMQLLNDGSLVKEFKETSVFQMPIQLLVLEDHSDPRFEEIPCRPISEEFEINSGVFFLAPKMYGKLCSVVGTEAPDSLDLKTTRPTDVDLQSEPSFALELAQNEQTSLKYFPGWQLAKKMRLSGYSLSRLTSNLQIVQGSSKQKVNIGLCLKFDSKGLKVLGYTRKTEKGWEYSQQAVSLIHEYQAKFPSLFSRLERMGNKDFVTAEDLFGANPKDAVEAVQQWLQEKGIKQLLAVPLNSLTLTRESVSIIEKMVDEYMKKLSEATFTPFIIKAVPRKNVLKPSHSSFRLHHQTFKLGDRVINAVSHGHTPLGVKGFVIGVDKTKLDVCWDFPLMHASSLNGLCSDSRASSVDPASVINLTDMQPPLDLKAPKVLSRNKSRQGSVMKNTQDVRQGSGMKNAWAPAISVGPDIGPAIGAPSASASVESMLKQMLHIDGRHEPYVPVSGLERDVWQMQMQMGGQFSSEFQPLPAHGHNSSGFLPLSANGMGGQFSSEFQPLPAHGHNSSGFLPLPANGFVPQAPISFDASWEPPTPVFEDREGVGKGQGQKQGQNQQKQGQKQRQKEKGKSQKFVLEKRSKI